MKRRSWLWFVASAALAILAGVLVIVLLPKGDGEEGQLVSPQRSVVVASRPIAANTEITVQDVELAQRDEAEIPSGAAVTTDDVLGLRAMRDIAQGEIVLVQDLIDIYAGGQIAELLEENRIAVALPADDILSKWGAVLPGDHVDVLFTLDVLLETPMLLEDILDLGEEYQVVERDQSLDNVSVLTLQNLEVLQILEEPQPEAAEQQEEAPVALPQRALVLEIDPQDAVVLKYLLDSVGQIDLALRHPDNGTLFSTEPVNINYLVLRYGIALPQPLE